MRFRHWRAMVPAMIAAAALSVTQAYAAGVTTSDAWLRYLLPQVPAGGFVTFYNKTSQPIDLVGAKSPSCGMTMLHRSINSGGVDRMVMVQSVPIPAGGQFRFAPGGYHIMCMQPSMKTGQTVMMTFEFRNAPAFTVPFKVYGADGRPEQK